MCPLNDHLCGRKKCSNRILTADFSLINISFDHQSVTMIWLPVRAEATSFLMPAIVRMIPRIQFRTAIEPLCVDSRLQIITKIPALLRLADKTIDGSAT